MYRVLVTGGAGFIGSNFILHMLNIYKDMIITNYDALTYAGNLDNLKSVENHEHYHFVNGDILDNKKIDQVMAANEIDYIINFAAETHVDRSINDANVFVKTNILGTQVLLEAARKHGVKKYIQISTDEVYGALSDTGYFTEKTPLAPQNPYSASKTGADLMVLAYYNTYHLPINITRCSNNYGPYQFPEKLIPRMILNAFEHKKLPIYGNGLNIRDWIHVSDHCSAIEQVLMKGKEGEIYNIGGNNERTNITIVKKILQVLGMDETSIVYTKDRLGHDYRYAIDATKIKEELSWQPSINFEEGLVETVKWYRNNQEWLKNIQEP